VFPTNVYEFLTSTGCIAGVTRGTACVLLDEIIRVLLPSADVVSSGAMKSGRHGPTIGGCAYHEAVRFVRFD
jgi:hypothetical protein